MNVHVPIEIQEKFACLEFRGQPFDYKGRKMIRARHKSLESTFYYSFDEDFAWLISGNENSIPEWILPKI